MASVTLAIKDSSSAQLNTSFTEPISPFRTPLLMACLMFFIQALRVIWIFHFPDSAIVQRMPDDAFYYLVLARNFALHHAWTFDRVAPASGFHILWGYILVIAYRIAPGASFRQIFLFSSLIGAGSMSVAAGLTVSALQRLFSSKATWPVAAIFFSAISLMQATWAMESPLALLFGSLIIYQVATAKSSPTRLFLALSFLAGVAGSLARSDFGLLSFWIALAYAIAAFKERRHVGRASVAFAQLAGAACGVFIIFAHTYIFFGHITQNSAQIKLLWASVQGRNIRSCISLVRLFLLPTHNAVAPFQKNFFSWPLIVLAGKLFSWALLLLVLISALRFCWKYLHSSAAILTLAMFGAIASYVAFYSFDGDVEPWYAWSLELPLVVSAAAAWATAHTWRPSLRLPLQLLVISLAVCGTFFSIRVIAPWQESMYRAGLLIHRHPEWKPVGAWNSGIMNYFGGGGVVNLDGLVNDELLPYVRQGTTADYIGQRHIGYLIDWTTFLSGTEARRNGIADGRLVSCITERRALFLKDPFDNFDKTHLTWMRLDATCLERTTPNFVSAGSITTPINALLMH